MKSDGSATRLLSVSDAAGLQAGDDHYRAFVGPPVRFDLISASQFSLLFHLGLRDTHTVLDFGCGSLRLGRLLIPFLQEGRYFGIDPNRWLIDEGLERELGRSALVIKKPSFSYNDDFDCEVFGRTFDYIIAQSIITHTGPDLLRRFFRSAAKVMSAQSLFAFSYIRTPQASNLPAPGWHYPECVGYDESQIDEFLDDAGLHGTGLPWYHPGATWHLAAAKGVPLPPADELAALRGSPIRRG